MQLYCPCYNRNIEIPLTKLNCPKYEESIRAETEHWKEKYSVLLSSLNTQIRQIEQKFFVNPAMELYHEWLVEMVNRIVRSNNL